MNLETHQFDPQVTKLYKDKVLLKFDPFKHIYTVTDEENGLTEEIVDSCTTILKVIAKDALVYWAANKAADFINDNLKVGAIVDEIQKKQLVDGCKHAHRKAKSDAADYGTMLHDLIERFAKGEDVPDPVNPQLKKGFLDFKAWVKEHKIVFKASERRVYSRKYRYSGTLDLIARSGKDLILIDIKTSSGIWDEYFLQMAAYIQAFQEEFPKCKITHSAIIRCGKDGSFEVKESREFKENLDGFLGAMRLHRRLKKMKRKDADERKAKKSGTLQSPKGSGTTGRHQVLQGEIEGSGI